MYKVEKSTIYLYNMAIIYMYLYAWMSGIRKTFYIPPYPKHFIHLYSVELLVIVYLHVLEHSIPSTDPEIERDPH